MPHAENLARTLDSFLDDSERLTRLSGASARVAAAHTWSRVTEQFIACYEDVTLAAQP